MWRDYDAIAHDAVITTSRGTLEIDYERAYKGHVEGTKDDRPITQFQKNHKTKCDCNNSIENRKANTFSGEFDFVSQALRIPSYTD